MFHNLQNAVMCLWTWVGYNSALIAQTLARLHIFRTKNLENKTQKNPNISNFNFRIRWSNLISFAAGTPPLQMLPKKTKKYSFNYCSCCQRQKQLRLKISTSTYLLRASSAALSFGLKNKTELKNVTDRLNR